MPCLLALLALISPRLVLFLLWIFSDVLTHAFSSWILPLLGFFLLPWTTLAYAAFWSWGPGHHVTGFAVVLRGAGVHHRPGLVRRRALRGGQTLTGIGGRSRSGRQEDRAGDLRCERPTAGERQRPG